MNTDLKRSLRRIGNSNPLLKGAYVALSRLRTLYRQSWSDEKFLTQKFREETGYDLNLNNPKTFNEKLQWLKLHDRNPIYTTMVDKYAAKGFVADKIGAEHIIPTFGVWDSFDDINFDTLPDQFVLKCTHDCGGLVICKDKKTLDKSAAKKKIEISLKRNYYWVGREWPYKNVKPRILAEAFMIDESGVELKDYKFMCFNGKVKCAFTVTERFSEAGLKVTFYDLDWKRMPFERHYPAAKKNIPKPVQYENMIRAAEILAQDTTFVRVDFYEVYGKMYFGELTFFPGGGMEEFTPVSWDEELGSWLKLPTGMQ